jgi:RNA polymerase sigma-70 factor (ECF subfamily)
MNQRGPDHEDAGWIERSVSGDCEAFACLVRKYQNRLYNSMVYFLRDETEAEDVVQESFVLSFTRLSRFRGSSSFYTWLYRIAVNTAISRRRKKRPQVSIERDLGSAAATRDDDGPAPGDRLDESERADQLHAALDRLNDEHRLILVLREMDGLSYEQISEILETPVGTVRSRLHRARFRLKEELSTYFESRQ